MKYLSVTKYAPVAASGEIVSGVTASWGTASGKTGSGENVSGKNTSRGTASWGNASGKAADRKGERASAPEKENAGPREQTGRGKGRPDKKTKRSLQPVRNNLRFLLEGAALVGVIAWLFYDSPAAAVFLLPLLLPYCRRRAAERRRKEKKELSAQFREMLAAMITALKAGYSPENAFSECRREMQFQFGENALITREMIYIEKGLDNRIALEKLLMDFAARWEIEEIREFAEVFSIARRSGGNLTEILGRTSSLIQDRMEIDTEIDLLLSSRKFEQKIMAGVPFFIIFYLGLTSEGFFDVLYHNAGGALFMTACLAGYLSAVLLSDRIMAIEL